MRRTAIGALAALIATSVPACTSRGSMTDSAAPCPRTPSPLALHVARHRGRAELADDRGAVVHLKGANVRFERRGALLPTLYSHTQLQEIRRSGIDSVRLIIRWVDLQPRPGPLDLAYAARVDQFLSRAGAAGLRVILDPIHPGGNAAPDNFLPRWANGGRAVSSQDVIPALDRHGADYLTRVIRRWCDSPAVVGIDLVNEPYEDTRAGTSLADRYRRLVDIYRRLIKAVRGVDPSTIIALEPYYGFSRMPGPLLASLAGPNLVWSLHDYSTGGPGDGYSPGGYRRLGAYDVGGSTSRGHYATDPTNRARRQREQMAQLEVQRAAAIDAGMPVWVGEFGIPWRWTGRREFLCDKVRLYRELGWSWTIYDLDSRIDPAFGLWDPATLRWLPVAHAIAGGSGVC
ncbi:MAG: endoglycoceramidase [Acidimicrobiales bacterium]|nr:endoglycoceramidase [Acidimicrobiales bacterium]